MSAQHIRLVRWIASRHLGERLEQFASLFGTSVARSNGLMLERATVHCREDQRRLPSRD